ncbi:MAG TPA: hypothetical protein VLG27_01200 [Candidatus Saccharimonadia bacterium]|nr:hypothetical protein [Candidatus Saccharimonadia bacterium]
MNILKPVENFARQHDMPVLALSLAALAFAGGAFDVFMTDNMADDDGQVKAGSVRSAPVHFSDSQMTTEQPALRRNVIFVDGRFRNH